MPEPDPKNQVYLNTARDNFVQAPNRRVSDIPSQSSKPSVTKNPNIYLKSKEESNSSGVSNTSMKQKHNLA